MPLWYWHCRLPTAALHCHLTYIARAVNTSHTVCIIATSRTLHWHGSNDRIRIPRWKTRPLNNGTLSGNNSAAWISSGNCRPIYTSLDIGSTCLKMAGLVKGQACHPEKFCLDTETRTFFRGWGELKLPFRNIGILLWQGAPEIGSTAFCRWTLLVLLWQIQRMQYRFNVTAGQYGCIHRFTSKNLSRYPLSFSPVDLTSLFHWNTKQLFLYLDAEYINKNGVSFGCCYWFTRDSIVCSGQKWSCRMGLHNSKKKRRCIETQESETKVYD